MDRIAIIESFMPTSKYAKGRRQLGMEQLYDSCEAPMMARLQSAGGDPADWKLVGPALFWQEVRRISIGRMSQAEAFDALNMQPVDMTASPPHPWLRLS